MRISKVAVAAFAAAAAVGVACSGTGGTREVPTAPGSSNLSAPTPTSPVGDQQLDTLRPTLVVQNATATGSGTVTYEFHISMSDTFEPLVVSQSGITEGSGSTSYTPASDLAASTRMYWRARAVQGASVSAWSTTAQFRTKAGGFNQPGRLFDPLNNGQTIGTRVGSTTFMGAQGLRIDNASSYVKYTLAETLTSGEISVEVSGLAPNGAGSKARIFSMMDGGDNLFTSPYLFNVQYRGASGNPDNAISFKVLFGGESFKFEPDITQRTAAIRNLNPATTYLWTARWGSGTFQLTVREGGPTGSIVYEISTPTAGTYSPTPHTAYLGANDVCCESGSYAGAIYRNFYVGTQGGRPASIK
jgi:hypothetical protein